MIGNDVIDLKAAQAESNWKRPRYLQKIFTIEEQQFVHNSMDEELAVWLLWSRKESVYKILVRILQHRFYAPKKIINTNLHSTSASFEYKGTLQFDQYTFSTTSEVTDTHIHTIARLNRSKDHDPTVNNYQLSTLNYHLTHQLFPLEKADYQTQHQTTRKKLLGSYAQLTNQSNNRLTIKKDLLGIPSIYHNNNKQSPMISISHHGHFGGFTILHKKKINN